MTRPKLALGQRVTFTHTLQRSGPAFKSRAITWAAVPVLQREGVYIGHRTVYEGEHFAPTRGGFDWDAEPGYLKVTKGVHHALVVTDERRAPVRVPWDFIKPLSRCEALYAVKRAKAHGNLRKRSMQHMERRTIVSCGGDLHTIIWRRGRLRFEHTRDEMQAELLMAEHTRREPCKCATLLRQIREYRYTNDTLGDPLFDALVDYARNIRTLRAERKPPDFTKRGSMMRSVHGMKLILKQFIEKEVTAIGASLGVHAFAREVKILAPGVLGHQNGFIAMPSTFLSRERGGWAVTVEVTLSALFHYARDDYKPGSGLWLTREHFVPASELFVAWAPEGRL